jgi:uncharacterized glyoxalase superfamily protein PhnB
LYFNGDCGQAIEFYQKALGAELAGPPALGAHGKGVMHALVKIGDSHFMAADAWPGQWEKGPEGSTSVGFFVYVEDCDRLFDRAVKAGCKPTMPPMDMFWGDRMCKVQDPFGHCWDFATHKWILTPQELQRGQEEWMAAMQKGAAGGECHDAGPGAA